MAHNAHVIQATGSTNSIRTLAKLMLAYAKHAYCAGTR